MNLEKRDFDKGWRGSSNDHKGDYKGVEVWIVFYFTEKSVSELLVSMCE